MPSFVQLLAALAITGLLVGFDRPALLVAGAAAGVWPDFLAWVLTPLLPWPDLQVTPDPNHPEAALVTRGLQMAAQAARADGRPWRVRLNPARTPDQPDLTCELDLDRTQTAFIRLGNQTEKLDWHGWLPRHPLPLRVSAAAVDLVLSPLPSGRIASDVAPVTHPAGHTWLWLLVWPAGAAAFPEMALVAGVVLALHLALDYGGQAVLAPLWPLSARTTGGLRTWNGARQATALGLGGLALLALIVELLTDAQTRWIAAHPMRALLLGTALSGLALAGVRRLRRDRPAVLRELACEVVRRVPMSRD